MQEHGVVVLSSVLQHDLPVPRHVVVELIAGDELGGVIVGQHGFELAQAWCQWRRVLVEESRCL